MKKFYIFLSVTLMACNFSDFGPSSRDTTASNGGGGVGNGQGGSMARFTLIDDRLYVATSNTLYSYSLENGSKPSLKSEIDLEGFAETIFPFGEYLLIGTQNGVLFFGLTDPDEPSYISTHQHFVSCDPVVAQGNYAYSTLRTGTACNRGINQLDIINIENIFQPQLVQSVAMDNPKGLGIAMNQLYVCDVDEIVQFDLSNSPAPNAASKTYPLIGAYDVIALTDRLIASASSGINQYSISQNGDLSFLSTIEIE